jgi:hypothetical protein
MNKDKPKDQVWFNPEAFPTKDNIITIGKSHDICLFTQGLYWTFSINGKWWKTQRESFDQAKQYALNQVYQILQESAKEMEAGMVKKVCRNCEYHTWDQFTCDLKDKNNIVNDDDSCDKWEDGMVKPDKSCKNCRYGGKKAAYCSIDNISIGLFSCCDKWEAEE